MRLAVWKTGHQIADTVADALAIGFKAKIRNCNEGNLCDENVDIGYGILRGMGTLFKQDDLCHNDWFEVDNGYFNPGHFNGYYRISYKGTQAKWHDDIPKVENRIESQAWRGEQGFPTICPPTQTVCDFFGIDLNEWMRQATDGLMAYHIRRKDNPNPINWDLVSYIITFNSSIGWQALQRGIPCMSDPEHSIVGSYYTNELRKIGLDYNLKNVMTIPREPLFKAMMAHQFTLEEIKQGKAWKLIQHYISKPD